MTQKPAHPTKQSPNLARPQQSVARATPLAHTAIAKSHDHQPRSATIPVDAIRTRAFSLWEQAGHPPGDGVCFWLQAEGELQQRPGV